jgi:hypothetical protein
MRIEVKDVKKRLEWGNGIRVGDKVYISVEDQSGKGHSLVCSVKRLEKNYWIMESGEKALKDVQLTLREDTTGRIHIRSCMDQDLEDLGWNLKF